MKSNPPYQYGFLVLIVHIRACACPPGLAQRGLEITCNAAKRSTGTGTRVPVPVPGNGTRVPHYPAHPGSWQLPVYSMHTPVARAYLVPVPGTCTGLLPLSAPTSQASATSRVVTLARNPQKGPRSRHESVIQFLTALKAEAGLLTWAWVEFGAELFSGDWNGLRPNRDRGRFTPCPHCEAAWTFPQSRRF